MSIGTLDAHCFHLVALLPLQTFLQIIFVFIFSSGSVISAYPETLCLIYSAIPMNV